ncbi:hypothetical protein HII31_03664 [Pseudocercospora fuligena]|uniref:Uncharacterized protein n=1 Tax=Pseudocercospora fuligena TaxID=685502 RepID=A0A8H6VQB1_9PEZI|nr:hypothetical protein HII31_03664 [Pseudocercospora fuligena]
MKCPRIGHVLRLRLLEMKASTPNASSAPFATDTASGRRHDIPARFFVPLPNPAGSSGPDSSFQVYPLYRFVSDQTDVRHSVPEENIPQVSLPQLPPSMLPYASHSPHGPKIWPILTARLSATHRCNEQHYERLEVAHPRGNATSTASEPNKYRSTVADTSRTESTRRQHNHDTVGSLADLALSYSR